MPIKFKLVERKDWTKDAAEGSTRYYAQPVGGGIVSFEELCESISEETALTSADVKSCFDRGSRLLARHLKEGRCVRMGEIGTFYPTVGSRGAKTEEEFQVSTMMKRPGVKYIPGKLVKDILGKISFERVKPSAALPPTDEEERPGEL